MWETIDPKSIQVDNSKLTGPHKYNKKGWLQWCQRCGLAALRNPVSELAHKLGCGYKDEPRFKQWLRVNR